MLYQFGLVTPVPSVIVYGVLPVFTLNLYTIPGFSVPGDTLMLKLLDGVVILDMSLNVNELQERVTHSKSSYSMSHPPNDQWNWLSF